jgi:hypothetical protein
LRTRISRRKLSIGQAVSYNDRLLRPERLTLTDVLLVAIQDDLVTARCSANFAQGINDPQTEFAPLQLSRHHYILNMADYSCIPDKLVFQHDRPCCNELYIDQRVLQVRKLGLAS